MLPQLHPTPAKRPRPVATAASALQRQKLRALVRAHLAEVMAAPVAAAPIPELHIDASLPWAQREAANEANERAASLEETLAHQQAVEAAQKQNQARSGGGGGVWWSGKSCAYVASQCRQPHLRA